MKSIHGLVLRVAALVVGSAIVGASIASNPATAQDVNSMLKALSITTCSTSGACKQFKNTGSGAGVKGVAGSGNGVIAQSTGGSATLSTSTNGDGVQAYSSNHNGMDSGTDNNSTTHPGRSGVYGHDDSTDGGAINAGVFGLSSFGTGVYGFSSNGTGGAFENDSDGSYTLFARAESTDGFPFGAYSPNGDFYIDNVGNAVASGAMYATAFIVNSDVVTQDGRHVMSYASRSADAEMSDVGTGSITDGHGIVQLDPAFARTLDMRSGYHVFLTPMGDSKGLYIASKSPASFEVRESQGGQSTLSFDYRIIGRAAGVKSGRLPAVRLSAPGILRQHAPGHVPTR
ncbi:MAG TPA: hypothetical protein VII69_01230 [Candidatus Eremiobacteraceae bacterium]